MSFFILGPRVPWLAQQLCWAGQGTPCALPSIPQTSAVLTPTAEVGEWVTAGETAQKKRMETKAYTQAKKLNSAELRSFILGHILLLVGRHAAITDEEICALLGKSPSYERTVRDAIRDLRKAGHPICSESGVGYWWPASREEAEGTAAELRSRATDMFDTAKLIEDSADRLFGGQRSLI